MPRRPRRSSKSKPKRKVKSASKSKSKSKRTRKGKSGLLKSGINDITRFPKKAVKRFMKLGGTTSDNNTPIYKSDLGTYRLEKGANSLIASRRRGGRAVSRAVKYGDRQANKAFRALNETVSLPNNFLGDVTADLGDLDPSGVVRALLRRKRKKGKSKRKTKKSKPKNKKAKKSKVKKSAPRRRRSKRSK